MSAGAVSMLVCGSCTQPAKHSKPAQANHKKPTRLAATLGRVVGIGEVRMLVTRQTDRMWSDFGAQALDGFEQRFVRRIQQLAFFPVSAILLRVPQNPQAGQGL